MRSIAAIALVLSIGSQPAFGQLPTARLDSIFPAGGMAGASVEVTLVGGDLDDGAELHFSHPGITAEQKMAEPTEFNKGPQPVPNQFVVTSAADVPSGTYDVRVRGKYGLSNPRVFDLSRSAEFAETEPNNQLDDANEITLPLIVNGQINGNTDVDVYRFTAQAGQRILFDCRARRIDSLLDPVLSVYDAQGRELVNNRDGYAKEAFIDFHVPSSGDYHVRITDALYRGSTNFVYRLQIGSPPHIDYVFPPAGPAGSNNQYTVYGRNLPGGQPTDLTVDGRRLEKLAVNVALPKDPASNQTMTGRVDPEQSFLDAVEFRVPGQPTLSNAVRIGISTAPVILEDEANNTPDQAQKLSPPCEVAGQFYPQRDCDWYAFDAKKGDTYTIEVISHRLGLPTDPLLVIQQVTAGDTGEEQVKTLATADDIGTRDRAQFDTRTGDAAYQFVAPLDATYRVNVRDGYSALSNDPRLVYRLAVRKQQPDFRLVAVPQDPWGGLVLRKGGRATIDVLAERRDNFEEPIVISVTGLPAGVTSSDVTLGPSMSVATLVLTAADTAAPALANLRVVGKAKIEGREIIRVARAGTANTSMRMLRPNQNPPNSLPARVSRQLVLSVADEAVPFAVELKNDKVWETTRAGILKIPFAATHRNGYKGQVQCTVVNLPANVNRTNFNIAANKPTGEFQLTLRNNTPAGTYTLHAGAFVTAYSYSRNPEAAAAAKQRQEEIDKIATEATKAAKEAATGKQQADKAATDAANALKAADQKATTAKAAEDAAIEALVKADEADKKADTALAAKPDDDSLKSAAAVAEKAKQDAASKAKSATEAAKEAAKAREEAQAGFDEAAEKKAAAEKTAADAAAYSKSAADEKKAADKRATDAANAAKAKNINYWTASTPFTIKIHEYPITFAPFPETIQLQQGEKTELPVSITRLVDYAEQVNLTVVRGVSGVSIGNTNIPKGQTQIKLPLSANTNASPGMHEVTLRATMRVNNQTLTFDRPFNLEIEKQQE